MNLDTAECIATQNRVVLRFRGFPAQLSPISSLFIVQCMTTHHSAFISTTGDNTTSIMRFSLMFVMHQQTASTFCYPTCHALSVSSMFFIVLFFLFTITYVLDVSPAQFNHFGESMFTMFRVCTLDNWNDALRDSQVGGGAGEYSCKCVILIKLWLGHPAFPYREIAAVPTGNDPPSQTPTCPIDND